MKVDPSTEDVHHWLEQKAVASIGMEAAGFLNFGKSRNDQVATALRMETRDRVLTIVEEANGLAGLPSAGHGPLWAAPDPWIHPPAARTADDCVPSHAVALRGHRRGLRAPHADSTRRVNLSPMGAAAFAGTSVKVDRASVASLLGFDGLVKNSMFAVSSRGFASRDSRRPGDPHGRPQQDG